MLLMEKTLFNFICWNNSFITNKSTPPAKGSTIQLLKNNGIVQGILRRSAPSVMTSKKKTQLSWFYLSIVQPTVLYQKIFIIIRRALSKSSTARGALIRSSTAHFIIMKRNTTHYFLSKSSIIR